MAIQSVMIENHVTLSILFHFIIQNYPRIKLIGIYTESIDDWTEYHIWY